MARTGWTRRRFLSRSAGCGAALAWSSSTASAGWLTRLAAQEKKAPTPRDPLARLIRQAPRARYWISSTTAKTRSDCLGCHQAAELEVETPHVHKQKVVRCQLCAQGCTIEEGERGRCRARMNVGGELRSLVYGRPVSVHVDPIEKKPFYHFLPGSMAFSMATSGCPLSCKFCQNWEISQARPEDYDPRFVSPREIVRTAVKRNAPILAYTYNEPTVFTEYLTDIARLGRDQKRRSVLVSCGFMTEAPLTEMCQVLDAIKIDLKGFSQDFYRNVCGADLQPVLRSIKQVAKNGTHLELVNLVVPTLNDSPAMMTELAKWVVGEVGPNVPVHFTRFHPDYQLPHLPPTPVPTLERAREIALKEGMHFAYVGNVPGHPGNHTYCPGCGEIVIERSGFFVAGIKVEKDRCKLCDHKIAGVWS